MKKTVFCAIAFLEAAMGFDFGYTHFVNFISDYPTFFGLKDDDFDDEKFRPFFAGDVRCMRVGDPGWQTVDRAENGLPYRLGIYFFSRRKQTVRVLSWTVTIPSLNYKQTFARNVEYCIDVPSRHLPDLFESLHAACGEEEHLLIDGIRSVKDLPKFEKVNGERVYLDVRLLQDGKEHTIRFNLKISYEKKFYWF